MLFAECIIEPAPRSRPRGRNSIGRGASSANCEHLARNVERTEVRPRVRARDHPREVTRPSTDLKHSARIVRNEFHEPRMRAPRQAWVRQLQHWTGEEELDPIRNHRGER